MVTIDELKQHLRIDHNEDDDNLINLVFVAQSEAESYMNRPVTDFDNSELFVEYEADRAKAAVKHAILIKCGEYYDQDRNGWVVGSMKETLAFARLLNPWIKY